jgi:hypothetical protein
LKNILDVCRPFCTPLKERVSAKIKIFPTSLFYQNAHAKNCGKLMLLHFSLCILKNRKCFFRFLKIISSVSPYDPS